MSTLHLIKVYWLINESSEWVRIVNTLDNVEKNAQKMHAAPEHAEAPPPPPAPSRKADAVKPPVLALAPPHAPTPAPPPIPAVQQPPPTQKLSTVLKLKLGNATRPAAQAESSKPAAKPAPLTKPKKHKAIDMPPPPYIDDGSHDLLQEVIAMEELGRGDKPAVKSSSSKQRRVVELDPEEELLSLAATEPEPIPEKRVEAPKVKVQSPPPPTPPPAPVAKVTTVPVKPVVPLKLKKPVEKVLQPSPSAKAKGKEKEKESSSGPITPHVSASRKLSSTPASTTPISERKCREVLKNLMKLPQAIIFARPVDPVLDGCPT